MSDREKISYLFSKGRTSRRSFIAGATALGLSANLASGLWGKAVAQGATTPKQGGRIRAGLNGGAAANSMDPTLLDDTFMISTTSAVRDRLVEVGHGNKLIPGLAESWEHSNGAKTWRFKLRQGVEFTNGKSFDTEDVIASLNLHRGEKSSSAAKGLFVGVEDIRADGKDVIEITLADANSDFPYLLTDYHMPIVPSRDGVADSLSHIGTGLYTLENFEPGVRAYLKRNPNAWQAGQLGWFDEAELIAINDITARQNAVINGEVDVASRPELRLMTRVARMPGLRVEKVASTVHYSMPMFLDVAPFNVPEFRQAMRYTLNRQEFIDKVLFGYGEIGNDNPIGPAFRFHDASLQSAEQDLDRARHLIEKAGLKGTRVSLSAADTAYPGAVDAAVLMAESAAAVGVTIDVIREPNDGYWSNVWRTKPWCQVYWGSRAVEDMILSTAYLSGAPWNDTHIANPQLDQLIIAARGETDEAKRRQQYSDIQSLIAGEACTLVPAFAQEVIVLRDTIATDGTYGPGWEMDGGHFVKRWWAA